MSVDTEPSAPGSAAARSAQPSRNAEGDRLEQALGELREAIRQREVDAICAAYLHLRRAARNDTVGDLFGRMRDAAGEKAGEIVTSAFAHRHCFMCSHGVVSCDPCDGSGVGAGGRPCAHCSGVGLATCSFCRGTGWVDRETVPHELAAVVLDRQARHTIREVKDLHERTAQRTAQKMAELPHRERVRIAAHLMRLQSRLEELCELLPDGESLSEPLRTAGLQLDTLQRKLSPNMQQ